MLCLLCVYCLACFMPSCVISMCWLQPCMLVYLVHACFLACLFVSSSLAPNIDFVWVHTCNIPTNLHDYLYIVFVLLIILGT